MFTANWYRYPNGNEGETMQHQSRQFNDVDAAINFIERKAARTRGIYFAGANVEDSEYNVVYDITSDYQVSDFRIKRCN